MTTTFTTHFKFGLPDFLSGPWHNDWYTLVRKIDQVMFELLFAQITGIWANSTAYIPGNIVLSPEDGFIYICNVAHTSAASPTTFAADRIAHPTFWSGFGVGDDLEAIEDITTFGILVRTADNLWSTRTLTPPIEGLTITNPAGIGGNPAFVLANDIGAIEALTTTGFPARTAVDTWALRTWTNPAAGLTFTNPAGVGGNPSIVLANDLGAIEGLSTAGIAVRTTTDTWAIRTTVAPAAGITITNPAGIAGDITLVLANDLAAIEALSTSGFPARTGTDTYAIRTFANAAAGITWTNPAGTAGNPTPVLANDLAALEALSGTGVAQRTGTDTWSVGTTITVAQGGTGVGTLTDRGVLFGRGTGNIEASAAGTAGQVLKSAGSGANGAYANDIVSLTFIIDGGGVAITTGVKGDLEIPFACTITGWTILADQSGSIVVDVWKDTFANYPPTVADTIAGSEKPTISTSTKGQDLSLSTWTTSVAAGDTLRFNVDSISTVQRVTLSIRANRL